MAEPQAKGINFRGFLSALERLHGKPAVDATLSRLSPEWGPKLRDGFILSGHWYPLAWYRELHAAAQQATGSGPDLASRIGQEAVRDDLKGIYRIFVRVASPAFVVKQVPSLVSKYFDFGKVESIPVADTTVRLRYSEALGFDGNLWRDMQGSARALMEATGSKTIQLRVLAGGQDGDSFMEMEISWT